MIVTNSTETSLEAGYDVVVIDTSLADWQRLADTVEPGVEVILIQPGADGWVQLANALEQRGDIGALHVISHGDDQGRVHLGSATLGADNLDAYAEAMQTIGAALDDGGDVLLYGCDVGARPGGVEFLDRLAAATGADVAASDDRTGATAIGGDWQLEIQSGEIESIAAPLDAAAQQAYTYSLATVTVTSNADSGAGTLRQAITDAQAGDTITFNSGMTIDLSTRASGASLLWINKNLNIDGDLDDDGSADVTLDGQYQGRVLEITSGSTVELDGLVIRHGLLYGDGGSGTSTSHAILDGGDALGAGLFNAGTLTLRHVEISGNRAAGGGGASYTPSNHADGSAGGTSYGFGGGGGGGYAGIGGGNGGQGTVSDPVTGTSPTMGGVGVGGNGGQGFSYSGYYFYAGRGGSTSAGAGAYQGSYSGGGSGGVAGGIGGGGGGWGNTGGVSGHGGDAVGGIYNAGTLTILDTNITANAGVGGGGAGASYSAGLTYTPGAGGIAAGGILNRGTLNLDSDTLTAMSGNAAQGGQRGEAGSTNRPEASSSATFLNDGGIVDTSYNPNAAPVFNNLDGDSVTFTEGGAGLSIDAGSDATVSDSDSSNFDGGMVIASMAANGVASEDVLGIENQGTGAGEIGVSGGNVTYGGTTIGTVSGGSSGNDLVISLNAGATPTATEALVRALTYRNGNDADPSTALRTVRITVSDGDGATSTAADVSVAVVEVNDAPTDVALSSVSLNQSSGSNATVGSLTTSDVDSSSFTYLLVSGAGDTDNGLFTVSGGSLVANDAGTMAPGTYDVRVRADDGAGGMYQEAFAITVLDDMAPTVTDVNISLSGASGSGGVFKVGDAVTATWDNSASGDNNGDVASASVDFSAFGGGAVVAAANSGSTWTATYTITAGSIDAIANVSVTATDNVGNSTTGTDTSNASVDNTVPTVADVNISLSGATGTGGAFKVGDTVTATWDNSASGDNNGNMAAVTMDFGAFGGGTAVTATNSDGTWTATHTITAGAIDATNLNVAVTATDNAGNSATTADTNNVSVDNIAPGEPSGTLAIDENSANGTVVGTVNDGGTDSVTYSLSDDADGRFAIDANTGAVTVANSSQLDYEASASHDVTVRATDDAGNATDSTLTVTVNDVNEVPTVDLDANDSAAGANDFATTFSVGGAPTAIADTDATLTDIDAAARIVSLTATLTNRPDGDDVEVLALDATANSAVDGAGLTVSYTAATGVLSISGDADASVYQAVLRGIQYRNSDTALDITLSDRTVQVIASDGSGNSITATSTVSLVTAPVVDLGGDGGSGNANASYTEGDGGVSIAAAATINEPDGDELNQLVIQLTDAQDGAAESIVLNGHDNGDMLNGITITYVSATQITLSGAAPASDYQALLQALRYENTSPDPDASDRTITVRGRDIDGNSGAAATLTIGVTPVNDMPGLIATATNPAFAEDGSAVALFGSASVNVVESAQSVSTLTLTVTNVTDGADETLSIDGSDVTLTDGNNVTTTNGLSVTVSLSSGTATVIVGAPAGLTASATQSLIDNLSYRNLSEAPTAANRIVSLTSVTDNGGTAHGGSDTASLNLSSTVNVQAVNDAPVFSTPTAINVAENGSAVSTLAATDAEDDTLTFSIIGGADAALFTLDANSGALSFKSAPDFESPEDQDKDGVYDVTVEVADGDGGTHNQALAVTVADVDETPSPDPDANPEGIVVTLGQPQPDTPSGLPSVSETITNTSSQPGSAKLVESTGNANLVVATLPGGVSLINQGARTAIDPQQALADLIASIDQQQPSNLADQIGVGSEWLGNLPSGTLLDIRTLLLSDGGGASTSTPIQITGIANGEAGAGYREAFVIDATALPSGSLLQLDNIDFASIIGSVTITGGAGANVVIGDDAAQTIVLGAEDDELHGGGGDDRLFGDAGNDLMFGGAGADTLHGGSETDISRYEGNRDDYRITQDHSVITVQSRTDPSDIDTLINIESLTFADGEHAITYENDLNWISGLYRQVLDRQADVSGIQYWAQQHASGLGAADIAISFLVSEEAGWALNTESLASRSATMDTLYQTLLGREADAGGKAYWLGELEAGESLRDVVGGFMASDEMQTHHLAASQWDFIA